MCTPHWNHKVIFGYMETIHYAHLKSIKFIIPCWTEGFGLDFRVCACMRVCVCASATIFRTCLDRFSLYMAQTTHDGVLMHAICFFRHQIQDGRLVAILVVKKTWCRTRPQRFLGYACPWHTFNLFKLGTYLMNDGLHMHVIFLQDQIKDGRLVAIGLLECVPNHFSDRHDPILFKLGTRTAHYSIHMPLTLFCDLIKDGQLVDWWPF